jgi:F-type H+-transporting ATPase subunit epsilon
MQLTVTTPRGYLVQIEAEEIAAPGVMGEFGVLPGHIPFMSVLKPGVLSYRVREGVRYLAVGDGILQVARTADGDKVDVLVDRGEHGKDVDRQAAQKALAAELKPLNDRRAWAAAQVEAAGRTGK